MDEENNAQVEEKPATAEQRLKELDRQRKELRVKVKDERTLRLEEAAKMRETRDVVLDTINKGLNEVLEMIYAYNKLGKVEKYKRNIFQEISDLLNKSGGNKNG